MSVSRLRDIPGIGVDRVGDAADRVADADMLRLENLDTDLPPMPAALERTRQAVSEDAANSYLPFQGGVSLRRAAAEHVGRISGCSYDAEQCLITAGGLNGILNVLLAVVEPGDEVVLCDPIYAGLVNRVRLAGAVPRFVSQRPTPHGWSTDPDELAAAVGDRTAAVLMMSPSMPTGAVLGDDHWRALAGVLERHDTWLIYDAAMERIRFDGLPPAHPAALPELAGRTITVGSASKELRMIGWRVGWVVGPHDIMRDIDLVGLSNVVCQVGLAQEAVAVALDSSDAEADVTRVAEIWAERARHLVRELGDYAVVPPNGGWSLLIDTSPLELSPAEAAQRLFEHGRIAATPMDDWGPSGASYLRLVFANEPVERLADVRQRFDAAFGA